MSKRKVFEVEEISEIIRLYTEEKMGTPKIGKIYSVDKRVINKLLKENGVTIDTPGRRNLGGKIIANKKWASKNKAHLSEYHKEWSKDKRKELREYHSKWREENREHLNKKARDYERNRRREDPKYRLGARTRTALWTCLKERNVRKYRSTFDLLDYTLEELMSHLESLFTEGMTWDNYGEWHVDHKLPMAIFQFESVEDREFKICWSLDNLQPLWGEDNLIKGSRVFL